MIKIYHVKIQRCRVRVLRSGWRGKNKTNEAGGWCFSVGGKGRSLEDEIRSRSVGAGDVAGKGENADPSEASGSDPQRTRGGSRKTDGPDRARGERRTWCRRCEFAKRAI